MKFFKWIVKEGKLLALVFVYFLFYYAVFILLKKLILARYDISYFGLGGAVVGALISAKAVLVIENSPLSKVLETAAPALKVVYDCFLYTVLALLFLYIEKVIEFAHHQGSFRHAFSAVLDAGKFSQFCATVIWAALAFLGYAGFSAIGRHIGHGELLRLLFTPRHKPNP